DNYKLLIDIIKETRYNNSYIKYSRYVEDRAKELRWQELLNTSVYNPLRTLETKSQIINMLS
ncbi:31862_t:CDS:1, partial [Gigaspora margarita]